MSDLVSNRKAFHDYEILQTLEAGISLVGTEVKSLRAHGGSLQDAYIHAKSSELYLIGAYIAPYSHGNIFNHAERRERKLLMHRVEIDKLKKMVQEKGVTLIPLSIYLSRGKIKVKVGVAKGKKAHDKRSAIKEREQKRAVERALNQSD